MDSFISAASDARFQGRVLVSSTDRIEPNADRILKTHHLDRVLLEDLRTSQIIFLSSSSDLTSGRK